MQVVDYEALMMIVQHDDDDDVDKDEIKAGAFKLKPKWNLDFAV